MHHFRIAVFSMTNLSLVWSFYSELLNVDKIYYGIDMVAQLAIIFMVYLLCKELYDMV